MCIGCVGFGCDGCVGCCIGCRYFGRCLTPSPVNGHGLDAHFPASEDDAASDFASIGDQHFLKGRLIFVNRIGEIEGIVIWPGARRRRSRRRQAEIPRRRGPASKEEGRRRRCRESTGSRGGEGGEMSLPCDGMTPKTSDAMVRPREHDLSLCLS